MTAGPDVLFLGPSLDRATACALLPDALVLPPAQMGDVMSAVRRYRPHAIGLVDGVFRSTMSVFHKELLYAMELGCWVLGAASMGALRAAECDVFGMIGVGTIYERLRSGELEDDDEVALLHGDEASGFRSISDALVAIRASVDSAAVEGLVSLEEAAELVSMQKARWFPERRLRDVADDARSIGTDPSRAALLGEWLESHVVDPKRDDALALIERLRSLPAGPIPPEDRPRVEMSPAFVAALARDTVVAAEAGWTVTFDEVRRFSSLHDADYAELLAEVRRKLAVETVSRWMAGALTDDERSAARRRVARQLGVDEAALEAEAERLDLGGAALAALVEREGHQARLASSSLGSRRLGQVTAPYLDELRLRGRYLDTRDLAALERRAAGDSAPSDDYAMVLGQFAAMTGWEVPEDLDDYVRRMELGSVGELLDSIGTALRAGRELFGAPPRAATAHHALLEDPEPPLPRGD